MQPGIILLREGTDTSQVRHDLGGGGGAPPRDERWHFGPRTKEKNRNCGRGAEVRSRFSWGGMPRAISFGAVGSLLLPPLLIHVYAVARATWWGQLVPVLPVPIFSPSALALGPVPRGGRTSPSAIALPMRSFFCHSPDPPPPANTICVTGQGAAHQQHQRLPGGGRHGPDDPRPTGDGQAHLRRTEGDYQQ